MTDDRSLQPDNRSGLQTALEKILDNAMATIEAEAPFRTLLFPMQAPKQFLPSLAIERGVQDWAATDTENAIRNTVANGLIIQSRSCTRNGIAQALIALGFDARVTRSGPYSISVVASLSDQPLDGKTSKRVGDRISTYKAERDSVSLTMVRKASISGRVGIATRTGQVIRVPYYSPGALSVSISPLAGVANRQIRYLKVRVE